MKTHRIALVPGDGIGPAMIDAAFEVLQRAASRHGFALEGTLRQSFRYADGRHHDEHLHARLVTDD